VLRDLLEAQRDSLRALQGDARQRAIKLTRASLVRVHKTLEGMQPGSWGWASQAATAQQLRAALTQLTRGQIDLLSEGLHDAARVSARDASVYLSALDQRYLGVVRPLRFDAIEWVENNAAHLSKVRLREYTTSFARYGASAVQGIEDEIAKTIMVGAPWHEARKQVWDITKDVVGDRQWMVDRILRTETSAAYNGMQLAALIEEDSDPSDPMLKRLVATFDSRTGKDSVMLHGQVRPVRQPFFDPFFGKSYQAPPNRPNDREVVVGWRTSYGDELPPEDTESLEFVDEYSQATATPDGPGAPTPTWGPKTGKAASLTEIRRQVTSAELRALHKQMRALKVQAAGATSADVAATFAAQIEQAMARAKALAAEIDEIDLLQARLAAKRAEIKAKLAERAAIEAQKKAAAKAQKAAQHQALMKAQQAAKAEKTAAQAALKAELAEQAKAAAAAAKAEAAAKAAGKQAQAMLAAQEQQAKLQAALDAAELSLDAPAGMDAAAALKLAKAEVKKAKLGAKAIGDLEPGDIVITKGGIPMQVRGWPLDGKVMLRGPSGTVHHAPLSALRVNKSGKLITIEEPPIGAKVVRWKDPAKAAAQQAAHAEKLAAAKAAKAAKKKYEDDFLAMQPGDLIEGSEGEVLTVLEAPVKGASGNLVVKTSGGNYFPEDLATEAGVVKKVPKPDPVAPPPPPTQLVSKQIVTLDDGVVIPGKVAKAEVAAAETELAAVENLNVGEVLVSKTGTPLKLVGIEGGDDYLVYYPTTGKTVKYSGAKLLEQTASVDGKVPRITKPGPDAKHLKASTIEVEPELTDTVAKAPKAKLGFKTPETADEWLAIESEVVASKKTTIAWGDVEVGDLVVHPDGDSVLQIVQLEPELLVKYTGGAVGPLGDQFDNWVPDGKVTIITEPPPNAKLIGGGPFDAEAPALPKPAPTPKVPEPPPAPAAVTPTATPAVAPPKPIVVTDAGWSKIGPQKGSNPGGLYEEKSTGEQWYVKTPKDEEIARNEALAAQLYKAAGIDVPDVRLATLEGRPGIASRIVDGLASQPAALQAGEVEGVAEGFVVDAWLGNWDVVGMGYDNLLVRQGKAFRVDTGGALRYRAQGTKKAAKDWGDEVTELESMRNASVNPQAASVFKHVTDDQIRAGIDRVTAISDDTIDALVEQMGPKDLAERAQLAATLKARRDHLRKLRRTTYADPEPPAPKDPTEYAPPAEVEPNAPGFTIRAAKSEDHARNEQLAAELYRAAGVDAADVHLVRGQPTSVAEVVLDGAGQATATTAGVVEGFVVDAWLANWTAAQHLRAVGGKAVRTQLKGALRYRAAGELKGQSFGDTVQELELLRNAAKNPQAASMFANVDAESIVAGIDRVAALGDAQIRAIVDAVGPKDLAERARLATTLIARRDDLKAQRSLWVARIEAERAEKLAKAEAERRAREKATKLLENARRRIDAAHPEGRRDAYYRDFLLPALEKRITYEMQAYERMTPAQRARWEKALAKEEATAGDAATVGRLAPRGPEVTPTRAAERRTAMDSWIQSQPKEDLGALLDWSGSSFPAMRALDSGLDFERHFVQYGELNIERLIQAREQLAGARAALANGPRWSGSMARGMSYTKARYAGFEKEYMRLYDEITREGNEVTLDAMSSFTHRESVAESFDGGEKALVLRVKHYDRGVPIDDSRTSHYAGTEAEILVDKGVRFRVVKVTKHHNGMAYVDLEVVDNDAVATAAAPADKPKRKRAPKKKP
jgi:hypothetical protein